MLRSSRECLPAALLPFGCLHEAAGWTCLHMQHNLLRVFVCLDYIASCSAWRLLVPLICRSINLPIHHPDWWFIDFPSADKQFAAEQAAYRSVFKGRA